jgi:hypothetical protein
MISSYQKKKRSAISPSPIYLDSIVDLRAQRKRKKEKKG